MGITTITLLEQRVRRLQEQVANIVVGGSGDLSNALSVLPTNGVDDTAAIQDRIDEAVILGKRGIHFGDGTWVIDCQNIADATTLQALIVVPGTLSVTGNGARRSILSVVNATSTVSGDGVNIFGVTSESNVVFDGLTFVGGNSPFTYIYNNSGCCIRTYTSADVTVGNCRFESLFGFSVHDDASERVHVLDCHFEDCANGANVNADYSIQTGNVFITSEGIEASGKYCEFSHNIFRDSQGVAISAGGNQSGLEFPGAIVVNNTIDGGTGVGIVLNDGFCRGIVANNIVRKCALGGIKMFSSGAGPVHSNLVANNVVDSNCVDPNLGVVVGMDITDNDNGIITGNRCSDSGESGFNQVYGLIMGSGGSADNCTVNSNYFDGTNKDASFGPGCAGLRLGQNYFVNGTQEFDSACTMAPDLVLGVNATDRIREHMVWNDSPGAGRRRWAVQIDGKQTWGNGLDPEDTNLYRSAADTLKTDDSFIAVGTVTGSNLSGTTSGTNTGDQTTVSGNAGTATTLATPRLINGVSFNGSANIETIWSLARKPASAHADDDEFESGSLSAWTTGGSQQGTAIDPYATFTTATQWRYSNNSLRPSWLMLQPANDAASIFPIHKPVTVGTNFMVWGRTSFNHRSSATQVGNDGSIALGIAATSGGVPDANNYVAVCINEMDANEKAIQTESVVGGTPTGPGELPTSLTLPIDVQYGLIQKIGSAVHFWVAGPSGNWLWLGSVTNAATFDRAFIRISNGTTPGAPGCMLMGIDFIRFYAGADKLP